MRLLVVVVAVLASTGCAHEVPERQTATSPSPADSHQTWRTPYRQTTCGDFEARMTPRQRSAMVADLLARLRSNDEDAPRPAAVVVDGFESAMADSCHGVPGTYAVTDVARSVYLTQRAHWLR